MPIRFELDFPPAPPSTLPRNDPQACRLRSVSSAPLTLAFSSPPFHVPPVNYQVQKQLRALDRCFPTEPNTIAARMLPTPPFGGTSAEKNDAPCGRADDAENDQYTIRAGNNMCWAVLCRHDTGRLHPRSLLGDFGHAERLPAWIHLISAVAFGAYGISRPIAITDEHTYAETLTTAASFAVCFCFLSSTVYHVTSPSKTLAYWTRQLDFLGIYTALAVGALADYAIATRSFQNVSVLSVLDVPLACACVAVFFFVRRGLTPSNSTWTGYLGGCTVNFGLFRRMHLDRSHTGVRQATSFVLAIAYFMTVPAVFNNFGTTNGLVLLSLEVAALLVLVVGMMVDNGLVWPDLSLSRGRGPSFLVCKSVGCIGTAHSLWHVLSVAAAVKGAVGREVALTWQR